MLSFLKIDMGHWGPLSRIPPLQLTIAVGKYLRPQSLAGGVAGDDVADDGAGGGFGTETTLVDVTRPRTLLPHGGGHSRQLVVQSELVVRAARGERLGHTLEHHWYLSVWTKT